MAYITKSYLSTQFTNFANKITSVFAKKTDLNIYATSLLLEGDTLTLIAQDGSILSTATIETPKVIWNGESSFVWNE